MTKTIAYLRVSTNNQDLEKNKDAILRLANEKNLGKVNFIEETVSGRVSWRERKIATILEELSSGDRIIVSELSRLGRSMLECMEVLSIATKKHIDIYAVKGNWKLDGSMQSTIVAMAFSMASEIEHDLISKRTSEASKARKCAGMSLGRPKGPGKSKLDKYRPEIEALLTNGATQKFIAMRYGSTEANLHHWLKKLARYCYNILALCELLNARSSEVKAYLSKQFNNSSKSSEFNREIYKLRVI